jgi:hypothetical protein
MIRSLFELGCVLTNGLCRISHDSLSRGYIVKNNRTHANDSTFADSYTSFDTSICADPCSTTDKSARWDELTLRHDVHFRIIRKADVRPNEDIILYLDPIGDESEGLNLAILA